jgi:hypothetical protein
MPRRAVPSLIACLTLACLSSACGNDTTATDGEETGEPTTERICDGSQDLRLAWFLSFGGGIVRTEFQFEVGFYYLYVRGDCHYWVVPYREGGDPMWIATHTGIIDEAQEAELIELLQYGAWDDVLGVWAEPGSSDAAIVRLHDGHSESGVGCVGECPDAPELVQSMRNAHQAQLRHWWELGEPSTGPMRVLAVAIAEGENMTDPVPWTVELELASLAVGYEQSFCRGQSKLVDDPATVAALREFRAEYAQALQDFSDFYVETASGEMYELYLRDSLPFEDEFGLIPQYNGTTPECW